MEISMTDDRMLPAQQSGVVVPGKTSFGPAQRDYYNTESWALTLPETQVQEILLNPEPIYRKRQANAPAFIKPASDGNRLAALVKILHEIPLAKKALLSEAISIGDYGHDQDWWDGTAISVLRVVNADLGHQHSSNQDAVYETQRLMAFLDKTDRAYGSINVLSNFMDGGAYDSDKISQFLNFWQETTASLDSVDVSPVNLFSSKGSLRDKNSGEVRRDQAFCCLDLPLERHHVDQDLSLYDVVDDLLWSEASEDTETFLDKIGEILTIKIRNNTDIGYGVGIDIPAVWYVDRYLESAIPYAKTMRDQKSAARTQSLGLDEIAERLVKLKRDLGDPLDASVLIDSASQYFDRKTLDGTAVSSTEGRKSGVRDTDIVSELRALQSSIKDKLQGMMTVFYSSYSLTSLLVYDEEKRKIRQQVVEFSHVYTKPTNNPQESPSHRYTLRGISTTAQRTYVLEKTPAGAVSNSVDKSAVTNWQWWKLEYISSDQQPVSTVKVSQADALEAARRESNNLLLVYASETAMDAEPTSLLPQLQDFVRADNVSFAAELDEFAQEHHQSPGKRKAMSDDDDDLITQQPGTPSHERDRNFQFDPPSYGDNDLAESPTRGLRTPRPTSEGAAQPDEALVPLTANKSGSNVPCMAVEQDHNIKHTQEMQERNGRSRLLQGNNGSRPEYQLGNYIPEMSMDDVDEGDR